MRASTLVKTTALFALFAGMSAAQVKNVAVVETQIDARSGAAAAMTSVEVALITTEIRREAVNNLPRSAYNIMTSKSIQAQGGAGLAECADENCVITLGSKVGADYVVRGIISKFQTKLTLSVEMYEIESGTLVASSNPIRSEKPVELLEMAAAACENMYRKFVDTQAQMPVRQNSARTEATTQSTVTTQPTESHTANVSQPDGGSVPSAATNKDRTTTKTWDTVFVTKQFAGYDYSGKQVYYIKTKILVGDYDGKQLRYRTIKGYWADGDTVPKFFDRYDINHEAIYRNRSVQDVNELQESHESQEYEDFSAGLRLGTWAINTIIPGLGSYLLMGDWGGGTVQLVLGVPGYICYYYGIYELASNGTTSYTKALYVGYVGYGLLIGNAIFNIVRSVKYNKPVSTSNLSANLKPYDGIKLAILPTESGDFKVFARYDYSF